MKKKKAVITIVGTIGGDKKAEYVSKIPQIERTEDINTLPILIKTFSKDYEIVALHTDKAKTIQEEVIKSDDKIDNFVFKDEWKIADDTEFDEIFSKIDTLISSYDKVIIDVSHGFRHLPILMMVDVIIHNIGNTDKIEMILFAKEIEKTKKYEFIDLKRYLDLANIAYVLNTFEKNYTVANNVNVRDKDFQKLLDDLSKFSEHILSNSLDELLRSKDNLVEKILYRIDRLLKQDDKNIFKNINRLLTNTKNHLEYFISLKNKKNYEMLFYIAKEMYKRGYLLNSITLLSEALGMYCTWGLKKIDPKVKEKIEEYEKRAIKQKNKWMDFSLYELYNQAKVFYRRDNKAKDRRDNENEYKFLIVKKDKEWNNTIKNEIKPIIEKNNLFNKKIDDLYFKCDVKIRNNLAHANTAKRLSDVKKEIKNVIDQFERYCIIQDVLNVNAIANNH